MRLYSAVIQRCPQTGLFVGFVPGFSGAHSQGETLDELHRNLQLESEFVGIQNVAIGYAWATYQLSTLSATAQQRERYCAKRSLAYLAGCESPLGKG